MVASGPQVAKLHAGFESSGRGLVAQSYLSQSSPENPLTRPQLHEQEATSKTKPFLHSRIFVQDLDVVVVVVVVVGVVVVAVVGVVVVAVVGVVVVAVVGVVVVVVVGVVVVVVVGVVVVVVVVGVVVVVVVVALVVAGLFIAPIIA